MCEWHLDCKEMERKVLEYNMKNMQAKLAKHSLTDKETKNVSESQLEEVGFEVAVSLVHDVSAAGY